ncbi:MAG: methyltransferase domain-containing protein [Fischerella sp. CENA71]|nr:methyltransferase domain-containing protein [Fischerella sp. CENA71]
MKHWYEISKDPNSPKVLQARQSDLVAGRNQTLINDRVNYLCELARGKDVLDVGIVEHTREAVHRPEWLHKCLCDVANSCLGIDILEDEINYLRSLGFNVICADITNKPLDQKFDVIICGEVLEHLDAPGYFLSNTAKMLKPNGRIVVSVPNPWYINVILKNLFNGKPYVDNADHVSWFDPCTLCEIGQRHGLILDNFTGIAVENLSNLRAKLFFRFQPLLIRFGLRPEIFAKTMIYEFVIAD